MAGRYDLRVLVRLGKVLGVFGDDVVGLGGEGAFVDAVVLVVLGSLRRARTAPVRVGSQAMAGLSAKVLDWSENEGHVFAQGERWQARSNESFTPGETVEVANINNLTLVVRRRPALTGEGGA